MATKAYVVSEGSFQYDDNYYSSTDGGYPNKVFLEKEQAEEYAETIGLARFKDLVQGDEIFNYGYGDIEGVFNVNDEFEEFIQTYFDTTPEDWWNVGRCGRDRGDELVMPDEDWKKFYSFCQLDLVYINEVAFGDVFS